MDAKTYNDIKRKVRAALTTLENRAIDTATEKINALSLTEEEKIGQILNNQAKFNPEKSGRLLDRFNFVQPHRITALIKKEKFNKEEYSNFKKVISVSSDLAQELLSFLCLWNEGFFDVLYPYLTDRLEKDKDVFKNILLTKDVVSQKRTCPFWMFAPYFITKIVVYSTKDFTINENPFQKTRTIIPKYVQNQFSDLLENMFYTLKRQYASFSDKIISQREQEVISKKLQALTNGNATFDYMPETVTFDCASFNMNNVFYPSWITEETLFKKELGLMELKKKCLEDFIKNKSSELSTLTELGKIHPVKAIMECFAIHPFIGKEHTEKAIKMRILNNSKV